MDAAPPRGRFAALVVAVAVLAYVTDQWSKAVALDRLADGRSRPVLGDLLSLQLIHNPGAALSLGAGRTWVMTVLSMVVLAGIVWACRRLGSWWWALAFGLLIGSALGNLTDRFVRPPAPGEGRVVDFINYNGWFIGNVADIWIVVGAALIVVLALRGVGVDGRRASAAGERAHD